LFFAFLFRVLNYVCLGLLAILGQPPSMEDAACTSSLPGKVKNYCPIARPSVAHPVKG